MKFADLHLHTVFSDGTYTPEELVSKSKSAGLSCIGIVDHDTVLGIKPSLAVGVKEGIEIIPGIELTADYNGQEIHILGYLLDHQNEALIGELDSLKRNRIERIYKITDKLKEMGVELAPEAVFSLAGSGTVGRLHVARAMVKGKIINSTWEAFNKFIGDKCHAYVSGFKLSPEEAINLIKRAKGVPILAHPYIINNEDLILKLIGWGMMGLEVYYPEHTTGMINAYLSLAKEYNLLITGGSDCHGEAKPEVKLGSVKIPYELVEKIREARESIR